MSEETRFIELETRLTYAEDLLDNLNQTLSSQQIELLELRRLCRDLIEQLRSMPAAHEQSLAKDNIPPHY